MSSKGRGLGINRDLVEQFEPQLVEVWQELEAHHGLWGMQGYAGSDAKAFLNVAEDKAREYVTLLRRIEAVLDMRGT